MNNTFQHLQVGDKVFLSRYAGYNNILFVQGTIVKKTPKGFMDITSDDFGTSSVGPIRFNPDGSQAGGYIAYHIDKEVFEIRNAQLKRQIKASNIIQDLWNNIRLPSYNDANTITKEELLALADRLDSLTNMVRQECESL